MIPFTMGSGPDGSELGLATLVASLLLFFSLGLVCWRLHRRLHHLESAARRIELERIAVPQRIEDPEPEITLPRFIGSPYASRKRSP